jgi:branched-subunit amino acid aminotransferase/4-amino-4-deoxychorismate lyase
MMIYTNGRWVPADEAVVPFYDQGFLYGDSLFETIRVNHSKPFRIDKHLERMQHGMDIIRLDASEMLSQVPGLVTTFIQKNQIKSALIRVMITRGVGVGTPDSHAMGPALYMTSRPLPDIPEGPVKVIFLEEKNYPLLRFSPAIKSGNYLGNMLAKKDADAAGAFEPVFVNREGLVTECAIRNVFFVRGNTLLTPSVELGVLPGVIRDTIMELARKRGMVVKEAFIKRSEADQMDEAFISSTGVGVLPVVWDGFQSKHAHSRELRMDLNQTFNSGVLHVS